MVGAVKEICIFMIIAQAVLFFVPGNSYDKYVRILIGIIMIMRFMEPLIQLFAEEDVKLEIKNRISLLEQQMAGLNDIYGENEGKIKDSETEIYKSMEEEMKKRLAACESDYEIVSVKFAESLRQGKETGNGAEIIITVSEEKSGAGAIYVEPVKVGENEKEKTVDESLKKMYADQIGVDAQRLEILLE